MLLAALRPTAPRCATSAANRTTPAALTKNQNANRLHPLFPWSGVARKVPPTLTKAPTAATKLPPNKKRGVHPEGYTANSGSAPAFAGLTFAWLALGAFAPTAVGREGQSCGEEHRHSQENIFHIFIS